MLNFFHKIQNADEETRKIWMFVFSAVTMAIVVGLWAVYTNFTIARVEPATDAGFAGATPSNDTRSAIYPPRRDGESRPGDTQEAGPGFFGVFVAGVKVIYDQIKVKVFDATNDIFIENPDRNFQAESVEPIPVTELP